MWSQIEDLVSKLRSFNKRNENDFGLVVVGIYKGGDASEEP